MMGALWAATPLVAQSSPPPSSPPAQAATTDAPADGSEIVVTGRPEKPTAKDAFDEAQNISRVGRHDLYEKALPRFWSPVCPGVSGLRTEYAEAMVDRMRANLARVKAPVAKADCSPNLVVAFVADGQTLLADLGRDRPAMFELMSKSEQAEMLADDAPAHVWNNIAPRWTGAGPPPRDWLHASVWGQLSRNAMPVSYDIVSSLVVFDRDAAQGLTLTQLADYATMRGLGQTRPPPAGQPMETILSLFEPTGSNSGELTDFDLGYLRSLYWSAPNASAAAKFAGVGRRAARAAKEAAPAKP
jgi:hypothetical protein